MRPLTNIDVAPAVRRLQCFALVFFLFTLFANAAAAFAREDETPLLVGEFTVARVVDGDTIAVNGLENTIRFLCIDTEECEKGAGAEERTARMASRYAEYVEEMTCDDPFRKFSTPMGWKAKEFAEEWFPVGSRVRIEYDRLSRKTGFYGRVLGYVFVNRDGEWVNYNIACVRAGMSPYFDKYGRSERFEADFIAAERDARIHGRGIWNPEAMAYPHYDDRLAWWSRLSQTITLFENKYGNREDTAAVMDESDWLKLGGLVGREVLLFGTFSGSNGFEPPLMLVMSHKQFDHVGLVFEDRAVFEKAKASLAPYGSDYVYARGILDPGGEVNGRSLEYTVKITRPDQLFVEIPEPALAARTPAGMKPAGKRIIPTAGEVHWRDAPKHLREEVSVIGRIVRTNNIGDITFLNFDRNFRGTLTIVVKKESYGRFPEPPEKAYMNRTVRVKGTVTLFKGNPQIVISGPGDIEILE